LVPTSTDHLPALDGIRAIAVLLVLLTHASLGEAAPWLEWFKNAIRAGYLGVDIFFVLSGFLVTRVLWQDWAKGRPLGRFLWRRSLRIFPAYYLLLAILLVVAPGWYLLPCAAYVSNITDALCGECRHPMRHAWSLAIEEQFYLVWPVLFFALGAAKAKLVARFWMPLVALATLAVLALCAVRWPEVAWGDWTYRLPTTRILSLALGCTLAFSETWLRQAPWRLPGLALGALAGALVVVALFFVVWPVPAGAAGTVAFSLISTSIVATGLAAHQASIDVRNGDRSPLRRGASLLAAILGHAVPVAIGRISYGLYLYHFPIFLAFGVRYTEDRPSLGLVVLALIATFAAAGASYRFVERPILEARDRIPTPAALWRRLRG
jgi:peptidoglycan/LPS O-acetylase OafA/YrhL